MLKVLDPILGAARRALEESMMREIKRFGVPRHVAIIMDGNRRWAKQMGLTPNDGHKYGVDTLENVLEWCLDVDVKYLTVYAFSTENFSRDSVEVQHLMRLFEDNFRRMADDARVHKNRVRIRAIGQTELLPPSVQDAIKCAESRTGQYDSYFYNVAVAYGGRQEIIRAIQSIAGEVKSGRLAVGDIDESAVAKRLYTSELPDPDLILRTSGEERISNFLLWQIAYAELYFADILWPGFRKLDFLRAIRSYQRRKRRFGS
ncbi:MAG: di-trans,poly-cis-decaprenylcistransferase [Euryarchaeota archaeon]|nr:di-trans,poly-cis-decaprenylcistransferase [Euryarchaeota archaeon]